MQALPGNSFFETNLKFHDFKSISYVLLNFGTFANIEMFFSCLGLIVNGFSEFL